MASSSSNPFRKKSALPEEERFPPLDPIDTSQAYAPPPRTSFPEPPGLDDNDSNDDDDTDNHDSGEHASSKPSTKASKPVKKVRIVSPPPLSPDSPEWPAAQMPDPTYAAYNMPPDPFGGSATDDSDREATPVVATQQPIQPVQAQTSAPPPPPPPAQRSSGSAPPPNPFSKTLQDIENTRELEIQEREEGEVLKAANASSKPTLDVDAFKRLLMTGKADTGEPTAGDAQDTSLEAKQEKLEVAENTQANKEKKVPPPPPPSSRHGKTLKTESKPVADTPPPTKPQPEAAKPVPQPPVESSETDDSSSEDDSADQAASAAAATSPPEQQPPGSAKKPAPAPPPRRGHGRTDTKSSISNASSLAESSTLKPTADDDPPSRSSLDSTPATKSGPPAPAPPPPRRPYAAPKQSGITPSPSVSSTSIPQREPLPSSQPDGTIVSPPLDSPAKPGKVPAPPPPPARHAPSRRPPSIQGVDSIPRKTSHEGRPRDGSVGSTSGSVPPPPPPPRMRGASPNNKTQGEAAEAGEAGATQPPGIGANILADLDALRREVDALRGRVD